MKNTLLLLLLIAAGSCCSNIETITYKLSEEEKALVPYQKQQTVKWQNNNGAIINGTVLDRSVSITDISDHDCKRFEGENISTTISINQERYTVSLEKKDTDRAGLYVLQKIGDRTISIFGTDLSHFGFGTVYFNDEKFNEAVKLEITDGDGKISDILIYTKKNGIEFILFQDGTWYKRVG